MNMNKIFYFILSFLILNCYGEYQSNVADYEDLNYKFSEAKLSFDNEKYSKAKLIEDLKQRILCV